MTFDEFQKGCLRTASGVTAATKENMLLNGITAEKSLPVSCAGKGME